MRDVKGESQVKQSKAERTEARPEGGLACTSDEVPVMGVERRGQVALVDLVVNSFWRMSN